MKLIIPTDAKIAVAQSEGVEPAVDSFAAYRALETAVRNHIAMYEGTSDEFNMSERSIGTALDALTTLQNERQIIPKNIPAPSGWQLVPDAANMTDEQAEAIAKVASCCGGIAYDIYFAALAAAPVPPSLPGSAVRVS